MLCSTVKIPACSVAGSLVIETCDITLLVICICRKERVGSDGIVEGVPVDVTFCNTVIGAVAEVESLADLEDFATVDSLYYVVRVDTEGIPSVFSVYRLDLVVSEDTVLGSTRETHRELVVSITADDVDGVVLGPCSLVVHLVDPVGSFPCAVEH